MNKAPNTMFTEEEFRDSFTSALEIFGHFSVVCQNGSCIQICDKGYKTSTNLDHKILDATDGTIADWEPCKGKYI